MTSGRPHYQCIFLDQVLRPCPLAPIIRGPAARGVEAHDSLEHYTQSYIIKYQHPHDYAWIHQSTVLVEPRLAGGARHVSYSF